MKVTNLDAVKDMAIHFLYLNPTPAGDMFGDMFVLHPYLNSSYTLLPSTQEMFHVLQQPDMFQKWCQEMSDMIQKQDNLWRILMPIIPSYKLTFFKYICDYLSVEDFANVLRDCYTSTEFPSRDVNVRKSTLVSWFRKADKHCLMKEQEMEILQDFPDMVTIYRGVCSKKYKNGLSWTLNIDQAEWFARRFSFEKETPAMYKCDVPKSAILAYWDDKEKEVILDYRCLKNCEVKEYELKKK